MENLFSLEDIYLSGNHIKFIEELAFPGTIQRIDLSHNNKDPDAPIFEGIMLPDHLVNLRSSSPSFALDLSFTKIKAKSIARLDNMSFRLGGLSLCYTEIPISTENFLQYSSTIEFLDLSGNSQLSLTSGLFEPLGNSLQILHIRSANLKDLDWTTPLVNLIYLDLYDNNIHTVNSQSFMHMTKLNYLNLEKNLIMEWYEPLFTENHQLFILNLRENKLSSLTKEMKSDLLNVELLALGNNEFKCNCVLQIYMHELYEYTQERLRARVDNILPETYQKYYEMAETTGYENVLNTNTSRTLGEDTINFTTFLIDYDEDNDDYECINASAKAKQPIIDLNEPCEKDEYKEIDDSTSSSQPPYIEDNSDGGAIMWLIISISTLVVICVLIIIFYWRWSYIKYFFILCKDSAILAFMDGSDDGKDKIITKNGDDGIETFLYDVFVSYSEQNRDWVLDELLVNVEKRESINVCLHERDFQVGSGILENIISCMDRSRCLLLVISENFLKSQWCQFEMNLAQHQLLESRRDKLILVFLEDIPVRKQPKILKYLMRTKTYIRWPENGSAEEKGLFWKRLKKSIISSKWETDDYGSMV